MCNMFSGHVVSQHGKDWGKVIYLSGIHHERDAKTPMVKKYGKDVIAWETLKTGNKDSGVRFSHVCHGMCCTVDEYGLESIVEKWLKKQSYEYLIGSIADEDLSYFPHCCFDSINLWFDDVIDRISDKYLLDFPLYCSNSINLWFGKVINRIPDKDLYYFLLRCSDSIDLWFGKVIDRMPDEDLYYFPMRCSNLINLWFGKVIDRIPEKYLKYFSEYCSDSIGLWGKHKRLKGYNEMIRAKSTSDNSECTVTQSEIASPKYRQVGTSPNCKRCCTKYQSLGD